MGERHELAYMDYVSGMKYKDIAKKYNVSVNTVKSRKTRYKWQKDVCTQDEKECVQNKKITHTKSFSNDSEITENKLLISVEEDDELTDRQKLFCLYWLKNKNATLAAIKAGYATESAHVEGSRLLRNAKVRKYVNLFISEVKNNVMIDSAEIVERYMKIAFADITDFVDIYEEQQPVIVGGKILTTKVVGTDELIPVTKSISVSRVKDSTLIDGGLISEISQSEQGVKIKLENRTKALEWLAKYFLLNPLDRHKIEFDNKRQELDNTRLEIDKQRISGMIDMDILLDNEDVLVP